MIKYKRNWMKSRGVTWEREDLLCEWDFKNLAVDLHHVVPKGIGGRANADEPANLIALCRCCHDKAHRSEIKQQDLLDRVALILRTVEELRNGPV